MALNRGTSRIAMMLAAVMMASLSCAPVPNDSGAMRNSDSADGARSVLERSAAALGETDRVAYGFSWGGPDDPSGWATGRTSMRRVTDVSDSWIRVEGTIHAQPSFGVDEQSFVYSVDGEQAWARNGDADWQTAPVGDGANTLSSNAVLGYLPEFIETQPYWKELGSSSTLRLLEPETVGSELCDVVEAVVRAPGGPPTTTLWSIARSDGLPRRGVWPSGAAPMVFEITNLEINPSLERELFQIDEATAQSVALRAGFGEHLPSFELARADGTKLTDRQFGGRVVVLDFWNTWCYLCRTLSPSTRALAADYADQPVEFYGVNVYETGDAEAYWQEIGDPYPMLLGGDQLAEALDIPWQPGVVVVGTGGEILYKELGASPDRAQKIRAAIERGLAVMSAAED